MKYRCLWCDATQQQPPQHDALKLYYQPVDEQSNWFYEICGVCESCCRLEWEEYRNDRKYRVITPRMTQVAPAPAVASTAQTAA